MDSLRKAMTLFYATLAYASGGEDLLRDSNQLLRDALASGATGDDHEAAAIIREVLRDCEPPVFGPTYSH